MTPKAVAVAVVLVLLVSVAGIARAESGYMGGNTLKEVCRGEDAYDQGKCIGFVVATASIVINDPVAGWRACIPDGVTLGQIKDIMVKFLDDHPEKLHLSATSLAAHAFAEAFPCPK